MKKIDRDIYEHGEIEREAARSAAFAPKGGLFYRFFKWIERTMKNERSVLMAARDEEREEERAAPGGVLTQAYVDELVNLAGNDVVLLELRRFGWTKAKAPLWVQSAIAREVIAARSGGGTNKETGE